MIFLWLCGCGVVLWDEYKGGTDIKLPITKLICVLCRNIIKAKYRNSITKFGHKFYTSTSWENSNCWLCWYQMFIQVAALRTNVLFSHVSTSESWFIHILCSFLRGFAGRCDFVNSNCCQCVCKRLTENINIIVVVIIIFFLYNYYRCNFWRKRIMCSFFNFLFLS